MESKSSSPALPERDAAPLAGGATDRVPSGPLATLGALLGLGAVVSSSCCVLPLALGLAGLGGAWAAELAALAPAKPYLLAVAGLALAGGWAGYLRRAAACARGCAPARRRPWIVAVLLAATLLFGAAAAWAWIEPALVGWLAGLQP